MVFRPAFVWPWPGLNRAQRRGDSRLYDRCLPPFVCWAPICPCVGPFFALGLKNCFWEVFFLPCQTLPLCGRGSDFRGTTTPVFGTGFPSKTLANAIEPPAVLHPSQALQEGLPLVVNRVYVSLVGLVGGGGGRRLVSHRPRALFVPPACSLRRRADGQPAAPCPSRSSRLGCPRYVRMGRAGCGRSRPGPVAKTNPPSSLLFSRYVCCFALPPHHVTAARIRPRVWYVRRWRGEGWFGMGPHCHRCWVLCVPDSLAPRPSGGFPLFLPCLAMPNARATSPAAAPAPRDHRAALVRFRRGVLGGGRTSTVPFIS